MRLPVNAPWRRWLAACALAALLAPLPVSGSHLPCAPPECLPASDFPAAARLAGPVVLDGLRAEVEVDESVAHTRLWMDVRNPSSTRSATAQLLVPMPSGAVATAFNLTSPDGRVAGDVRETAKAQPLVASRLQVRFAHASERILAFNVTLGPAQAWTLQASYAHLVPLHHQVRVYRFPLDGLGPVGRLDLSVAVHSRHGVVDASFAGLPFEVTAQDATDVRAEAHLEAAAPGADAVVAWSEGPGDWLASMLCGSKPGGWTEGLLLLQARASRALPRDVVFVIDHSGSMKGEKMESARLALSQALDGLADADRYEVVQFDNRVEAFHSALVDTAGGTVASDRLRLERLQARGSTDIDGGLQLALAALGTGGEGRTAEVVLLTDGMPTSGVTAPAKIIDRFVAANRREAALHVLAIGLDARQSFLRDLAESTGGTLEEVRPEDGELRGRIGTFLDRLAAPLATGVQVKVMGFEHAEVLGGGARLYEDTTLAIAFGDLWSGHHARWVLQADTAEGRIERPFLFPAGACPVIPAAGTLGAKVRLEWLLSRERTQGSNATSRDEVTQLALGHRLESPYTRWVLVDGGGAPVALPQARREGRGNETQAPETAAPAKASPGPALALLVALLGGAVTCRSAYLAPRLGRATAGVAKLGQRR